MTFANDNGTKKNLFMLAGDVFYFFWKLSMSSIKRDVKKKVLPRPEGEKILSRDPAHFAVRVPLDLGERFCF
jgi:DNA-binding transcriptional regulator GbsR (MarR family)